MAKISPAIVCFLLLLGSIEINAANSTGKTPIAQEYQWKAGVSKEKMTPQGKMWLGGFAFRDRPSEGTMEDLWIRALALEDAHGQRAVLVTTDIVGMPKAMSDRIRSRLKERFNLSKAQIILNSSHTHSGPVLIDELNDYYAITFGKEELDIIRKYSEKLEAQIFDCVEQAIKSLRPAQLSTGNGATRFQVNRRTNVEAQVAELFEVNGPNDYAVPVIRIQDLSGKMISIVFGYACHVSVVMGYVWSPDYPGFACIELDKMYPGATSMFFQGCGGDVSAWPRGTESFAKQYGKQLATAVERVLSDTMSRQPAELKTAYSEIDLPFSDPPTVSELKKISSTSTGYDRTWANRILAEYEKKGSFVTSYPYPIQIWMLGKQPVFSLGGEVVIEYSQELKRMFGNSVFVMAYNNDVMAYIPTSKILKEGGYEGASALMYFNSLVSSWGAGIESRILFEMEKLASTIGLSKTNRPLIRK